MQNRTKTAVSFRLSPAALELLKKMAAEKGISQTAVLEIAIREMAKAK